MKHKHLGVILSTKLSSSSHNDEAVKARKVWEIIQRTVREANVLAKLQLYNSLVVPLLEYASCLEPTHHGDTQKCELVQKHVTLKAILRYQNMDYETQLLVHVLGLVSLEECRRTKDLSHVTSA